MMDPVKSWSFSAMLVTSCDSIPNFFIAKFWHLNHHMKFHCSICFFFSGGHPHIYGPGLGAIETQFVLWCPNVVSYAVIPFPENSFSFLISNYTFSGTLLIMQRKDAAF